MKKRERWKLGRKFKRNLCKKTKTILNERMNRYRLKERILKKYEKKEGFFF